MEKAHPLKRRLNINMVQGNISQKTELFKDKDIYIVFHLLANWQDLLYGELVADTAIYLRETKQNDLSPNVIHSRISRSVLNWRTGAISHHNKRQSPKLSQLSIPSSALNIDSLISFFIKGILS
jgi:hypothetical protein